MLFGDKLNYYLQLRAVLLGLRMGYIFKARAVLKSVPSDLSTLPREAQLVLDMLTKCETLEVQYGVGALLDLRHPSIQNWISTAEIPGEWVTASQKLQQIISDPDLTTIIPELGRKNPQLVERRNSPIKNLEVQWSQLLD